MSVVSRQGNYPHIEWLNLRQDGTLVECAIMKKDAQGNRYFIEVGSLDSIDKKRIVKILTNRNARNFPLWDLMSQTTLNNGVNALNYFHQLVRVLTPSGTIQNPRTGEVGYAVPQQQAPQTQQQVSEAQNNQEPVAESTETTATSTRTTSSNNNSSGSTRKSTSSSSKSRK